MASADDLETKLRNPSSETDTTERHACSVNPLPRRKLLKRCRTKKKTVGTADGTTETNTTGKHALQSIHRRTFCG
jgi:hypothetical protein